MNARRIIEVTHVDVEQYDGDFPPTGAIECIAWLQKRVAEIPMEFRDTARIEIESEGSYEDSHYAHVRVIYARPETDEELGLRLAEEAARLRTQAAREQAEYERLRRKYGAA